MFVRNSFLMIIGLLFFSQLVSCTQKNVKLAIEKRTIKTSQYKIIYYVGYNPKMKTNSSRVLFFIRGTGRFKAKRDFGMGAEASLLGFDIVYPQKAFVDDPRKYYTMDNRYQRMFNLTNIIEDLIDRGVKHFLILSDSEGSMLAPEIARIYSNRVIGLICLGGELRTFEESLTDEYRRTSNPMIGILNADDFVKIANRIFDDPTNTVKDFYGHSYKFWASYLRYDPLSDITNLTIPVLYINGSKDVNYKKRTDIIKRMKKAGVTNFTQIIYPGVGHKMNSIKKRLTRDIIRWTKKI